MTRRSPIINPEKPERPEVRVSVDASLDSLREALQLLGESYRRQFIATGEAFKSLFIPREDPSLDPELKAIAEKAIKNKDSANETITTREALRRSLRDHLPPGSSVSGQGPTWWGASDSRRNRRR